MKKLLALGVGLFVTLLMLTIVTGIYHAKGDRALKAKADKFDDYCLFVRAQLEAARDTLADVGDSKIKLRIAQKFYEHTPGLDRMAIWRCASSPVEQREIDKIRGRCRPPSLCTGDACQVNPTCLVPVIDDLLRFLP